MLCNLVITGIGAVAALVAAVFWLWASLVSVPADMDTFIGELQRASRLNAKGAAAAFVAALCATFLFARTAYFAPCG